MNRDQKAAVIEEIAADITASQAIFAVDYRGITVAQADALRARLREAQATFRVVKNSLSERAADQADAELLKPLLSGPTALTFVRGDAASAAKAVADFARTTQLLAFKGGLMDGAALSATDVASISRLPSRDVLYGQLVGLVAAPVSGLARTLNALIGGLAVALGGVREKKESGELPAGPAPERASAAPESASATTEQANGEAEAPEEAAGGEAEAPEEAAHGEAEAPEEAAGGEAEAPEEAAGREAEAPEEAVSGEAEPAVDPAESARGPRAAGAQAPASEIDSDSGPVTAAEATTDNEAEGSANAGDAEKETD
jgi:large subunit ribosomal protein L10